MGVDIPLDNEVVTSLSPYVGIRYSTAKAEFGAVTHDTIAVGGRNYTGFSGDLDATDNFGMIAGCDAALWKSFDFNIEGRFADETAMTVGGSYSF